MLSGQSGNDTHTDVDVFCRIQVIYSTVTDTGTYIGIEKSIYTVHLHVYVYMRDF